MPLFRVIGVRRAAVSYSAVCEIEAPTLEAAIAQAIEEEDDSGIEWRQDSEEDDGPAEWEATEVKPAPEFGVDEERRLAGNA